MKRLKDILLTASALLCGAYFTACSDDNNTPDFRDKEEITYDMSGFIRGADVSWLTEMEYSGYKFYNAKGQEQECMSLLRDLGMNAIRLRVWVNPANPTEKDNVYGWCNKEDVVLKAWRAHNLGYRLMIDFHYSDAWADPGKQYKPQAWKDHSVEELQEDIANHTKDVLNALKEKGIAVEWVQVGNETRYGMLFDEGNIKEENGTVNFAKFVTAGYNAVKEVYPQAKVIVHIDRGNEIGQFQKVFGDLQANQAKWDIIGMSLYPQMDPDNEEDTNFVAADWRKMNTDCIANMQKLYEEFNTPIMMCEIGMTWNNENAEAFYTDFITKAKLLGTDICPGVFAWEPQCYGGWKGYHKGMFDDDGKPTSSFNAFKR